MTDRDQGSGIRERGRSGPAALVLRGPVQRAAFTLVEMLVSLAVIVVALAVVVTAFTITTRTARQAAAFAELQGWVRQFTSQVQDDLKHCDPAQSVLVLFGRVQPAGLTVEDIAAQRRLRFMIGNPDEPGLQNYDPVYSTSLDAPGSDGESEYSDPRADIIMFFTNRPTVSQAPALDPASAIAVQQAIAAGARSAPVQIVYGHAARGEAVRAGAGAATWAAAETHIENTSGPSNMSRLPAGEWHLSRRVAIPAILDANRPMPPDFSGEIARLVRCEPTATHAGDVVGFRFADFMQYLNNYARGNDGGDSAYALYRNSTIQSAIDGVLYADAAVHHVATVLDRPPVDLRSNLGVHMLPGCAWFQVEFLMPEDARNSLDYNPDLGGGFTQRNQRPIWMPVDPGETYVFLPDTAENRELVALSGRASTFTRVNPDDPSLGPPARNDLPSMRIRMWPYAVRLTIRAYDPRGRLPEPIVRSIVHRFE